MKRTCARGIAIVLALLLSGLVHAAPRDAARQSYAEATRRYDIGEYEEALRLFKKVYLSYEDPAFLYNIGQCHRQLGQKQEAIRAYRSYLSKAPNAPNRAEVVRFIETLEAAQRSEEIPKPAPEPAPAPTVQVTPPAVVAPEPVDKPTYKKWWPWAIVGGVVVVGLAVGLGVGLTQGGSGFHTTVRDMGPAALTVKF